MHLKLQSTKYGAKNFKIVINMSANKIEGNDAFRRLHLATDRFLNVELDYLGSIVYDTSFTQAVRHQKPFIEMYPRSTAALCFQKLAERLTNLPTGSSSQTNLPVLWQQLFTVTHSQPLIPQRQSIKAAQRVACKETY